MIATNTITSTSVLDVDTAAPNATPSAAKTTNNSLTVYLQLCHTINKVQVKELGKIFDAHLILYRL